MIYQVYPRSFQDSDGDGVGDLRGIIGRLPHLTALGIDALWLSPIFPSPMADFGYDIADYTGIEPLFGTMADFDDLLNACHAQGLRLLLDFHYSDYWADPGRTQPGSINRHDGGRGVYFCDPDGHFLEIITRPYGGGDPAP